MPVLAAAALLAASGHASAAAPSCSREERAALLAPASDPDEAVPLACSVTLGPGEIVTRRIVIEGGRASGTAILCEGGAIGRPDAQPRFPASTVEIRSRRVGAERWDPPADIRIVGCTIAGPIRIWGMGQNGQGADVRASSHRLGHTERAQAAAPSRVVLDRVNLEASGAIPLYLGPGVTEVALTRSRVTGRSVSTAVYLDAESARNRIEGNTFSIDTAREQIAIDGSAENRVTNNDFALTWRPGIELYRNCGEGGTVRHQTPSRNLIAGNHFAFSWPVHRDAVIVGSREGWRLYCGEDDGFPFGSSADNRDGATDNVVRDNRVE